MNQQTLYVMVGLPYSGKTTLRKELVKRCGFSVVSVDAIMDEKDMWREGHPTQDDWNVAYSEAYEQIKKCLKEGESVILDGATLLFSERETPREIARSLDVPCKIIYINTSKEEILKRHLKNKESKERDRLEEQELETALNMFEEPKPEEDPLVYNSQLDLDTWIQKNI